METELPSLIELYQDSVESEFLNLSPQYPVVAICETGDQVSFDLSTNSTNPELVETSGGDVLANKFKSWEHFLMQAAILMNEPRRLSFGRWFASSPASASQLFSEQQSGTQLAEGIQSLIAKLGLSIAWPSDAKHTIAVGKDFSIFIEHGERNTVSVRTFSNNADFLQSTSHELTERLGTIATGVLE